MKRGLIIGKFMPIHKGHMALIEFGAKHCDELTVIVCTLKGEEIQGRLRYQWVKSLYRNNKKIKVKWITKSLHKPNLPAKKATKLWGSYILNHYGRFDYIFSSENYGDYLAQAMGAKHILFDKHRNTVPISATMIRNNPEKYWGYIPDVVRMYYFNKRSLQSAIRKTILCSLLGILTFNRIKCQVYE